MSSRFKLLQLFLLLTSFVACKKDTKVSEIVPATDYTVENGRLSFKSHEAYYAYVNKLGDNPETPLPTGQEFTSFLTAKRNFDWMDETKVPSKNLTDLMTFNFPSQYEAVINERGEVKIGDEIAWYHDGQKYFIPESMESELSVLKSHPEKITKKFRAGGSILGVTGSTVKEESTANLTQVIGLSDLHAKNQLQFWATGPNPAQPWGWRKYVHELFTFTEGPYPGPGAQIWVAHCALRVKLEWKGSKWRPAGEMREFSPNITGTAVLNGAVGVYYPGPNFAINTTNQANYDWTYQLARFNGNGPFQGAWSVSMNGSITHRVINDIPANIWVNTGVPTPPLW